VQPPASTAAPPTYQQHTASSAPSKLSFPPHFISATCVSFCMQNIRSACRRMGGK
jgi:hypothetical protein